MKQDGGPVNEQPAQSSFSDSSSTASVESDDFLPDTEEPGHYDNRMSFLTMFSPTTSTLPSPTPGRAFQRNPPLLFSSAALLLEHVTRNWRLDFVTVDITTRGILEMFTTRPFFMVISVDAPIISRYQRAIR